MTKETFEARNAKRKIDGTISGYQREVYELTRKDGWVLRAYIPRYIGNFVDFNIVKE